MRLRHLFLVLSLLLSLTVLALSVGSIQTSLENWRKARGGLADIQHLQALLVTAEMASRERGPANGVLGDDTPGDPARKASLVAARGRTDAAFAAVQAALGPSSDPGRKVEHDIDLARARLLNAREAIDQIASRPRSERSPGELRDAVARMFGVIDDLQPAMIRLANEAQATYPSAADALLAARLAANLREYAGQLGSQFTATLTTRQPLTAAEHVAIERLRGRVDQLARLLVERTAATADRPAVRQATAAMLARYFGSAIPFVEAQTAIGLRDARYDVDAAGFAARYVPDMDSIVALRDALMGEALSEARNGLAETRRAAFWMGGGSLFAVALLAFTLGLILRRVVRPLRRMTRLLVAIAQGHLDVEIPEPRHRDELADVFAAIAVLRRNGQARVALEAERQRLVEQLRDQSNTDFLTGLPNRRGFFELAEHDLATLHRHGHPATLAMFDIDHFKQVNDTHGHAIGDTVLAALAQVCRQRCRSGDIVARYGGEEFLLLMPYCGLDDGAAQAERLRQGIEAMRVALPGGGELKVTASFGVESCLPGDASLQEVISRADERLYAAKNGGRNRVVWSDSTGPR